MLPCCSSDARVWHKDDPALQSRECRCSVLHQRPGSRARLRGSWVTRFRTGEDICDDNHVTRHFAPLQQHKRLHSDISLRITMCLEDERFPDRARHTPVDVGIKSKRFPEIFSQKTCGGSYLDTRPNAGTCLHYKALLPRFFRCWRRAVAVMRCSCHLQLIPMGWAHEVISQTPSAREYNVALNWWTHGHAFLGWCLCFGYL